MHVDGFRFDLASVLSRDEDGQPSPAAADHLGHRDRPGPRRHEAHRRGVGRGRPVPGRLVRGRPLGRVERAVPRRRALVRQERPRQGAAAVAQRLLGSPDIYAHLEPRAPEDHQLRHLPRRVHAQRRGLLRPQAQRGERRGQPRRQRRQPAAGTAASRARPTTRRSRRCASARSGTCWRSSCWPSACRCCTMGDEVRRTQLRQQQRLLPGQRSSSWFDWALVERTPTCCAFCQGLIAGRRRPRRCSALPDRRDARRAARGGRGWSWHGAGSASPTSATTSRIHRPGAVGRARRRST